jgi:DNA polymerase III delta prime subunit
VIIVEGPDGAGKTTLAHQLAREFGLQVEKKEKENRSEEHGPPARSARERTWEALGREVSGNNPVVIHDRLFLSELVYGPIVRHKCEFTSAEQLTVIKVLLALQVPIILCLPDWSVVYEALSKHGAEQYAMGQQKEIYDTYKVSVPPLLQPVVYDWTAGDNAGAVKRRIVQFLEDRKVRTWG